ncbi:SO2930 family diheme c-type cytochrome [Ferrimonas pelagia]|uniref:SO2930 family diheme c-type cytochrome n=2 Tax=Ferrimonas pelagia TaxID=1177826 RepID=A0ABP9ETN7_9GAMM
MSEDCPSLSDYSLFVDPTQPTRDPRQPGQQYLLTAELFSDHASKYRYLFLPQASTMEYQDSEVISMPVGTVLVKSFALPADTGLSGANNETLIETRLLIHRESGWVALPYVWQDQQAKLALAGAQIPHTLIDQGEEKSFTYQVPSQPQCKQCHQRAEGERVQFSPIGPKARLLNRPGSDGVNQLARWQANDQLTGVPEINTIPTAVALSDDTAPSELRVRSYLDVNCGHCHRPEGQASLSGLRLGFFVEPHSHEYGLCKQPPGYDGGEAGLDYDIVPANGNASILPYRMEQLGAKDRMPPIGRALSHTDAITLVRQWIDSLPPELGQCH